MMRKGTGRISRLSRTNIFALKGLKLRPFGLLPAFWCTGACQHNGNFTLQIFQAQLGNVDYPIVLLMVVMAIRVVEFSRGDTKLDRFLPKNQHTQMKLLNFENWCNGEVSRVGKEHCYRKK